MAESITIFRDPQSRYYNVVIDGRIVSGAGPDEALATVACALFDAQNGPPYAKACTMDELRDIAYDRGRRAAERAMPAPLTAQDIERIVCDQSDPEGTARAINEYFTRHITPEIPF